MTILLEENDTAKISTNCYVPAPLSSVHTIVLTNTRSGPALGFDETICPLFTVLPQTFFDSLRPIALYIGSSGWSQKFRGAVHSIEVFEEAVPLAALMKPSKSSTNSLTAFGAAIHLETSSSTIEAPIGSYITSGPLSSTAAMLSASLIIAPVSQDWLALTSASGFSFWAKMKGAIDGSLILFSDGSARVALEYKSNKLCLTSTLVSESCTELDIEMTRWRCITIVNQGENGKTSIFVDGKIQAQNVDPSEPVIFPSLLSTVASLSIGSDGVAIWGIAVQSDNSKDDLLIAEMIDQQESSLSSSQWLILSASGNFTTSGASIPLPNDSTFDSTNSVVILDDASLTVGDFDNDVVTGFALPKFGVVYPFTVRASVDVGQCSNGFIGQR